MAGNAVLRVDGTVYQNEGGLAVWGGIAGDYTVSILAGGAVMATATPGRAAMQFDAVATIYNAGLVQSMRGNGIIADGGSAITNTGSILSADTGIILARSGGSDGSLINDGLIRAGQVTTSMAGHGVQIRADNVSVWNGGVIHTDKSGAAAIMVGAFSEGSVFGAIIENHGTITARAGYGINAFANGGLAVTVLNTGTITGGLYGIKGSRGEDDITNTGTTASLSRLFTSVFLDKGFGVFNNSGYITGDIYMGQDADIYNGAGTALAR